MRLNVKKIKLELFYLRKSFFNYKSGFKYVFNKYILAPKILKSNVVFEKPINYTNLSIHILTCRRDLIMTIWSLASFYSVSNVIGQLYIHNDGSLSQDEYDILKSFFPSSIIVDNISPENYSLLAKYPEIIKYRKNVSNFVLLKKLIDPYLVSDAQYRLVIDSDLVWFDNPSEVEEAISSNSDFSLVSKNIADCLVIFKDNSTLSEVQAKVNSGIVFYKKENFNLKKLAEYFLKFNVDIKKNHHFIEQAGYAYSLENIKLLSSTRYTAKDKYNNQVVVRHYTSPRRPLFFIEGLEVLKNKIKLF